MSHVQEILRHRMGSCPVNPSNVTIDSNPNEDTKP